MGTAQVYYNDRSDPILSETTFSHNTASNRGGALYNDYDTSPMLINVTLSHNSAVLGGALYNDESTPHLTHVTLSDNSASTQGGAIYNTSSSTLYLTSTLIANSTNGGDCFNFNSTVTDGGHNLIEDAANACGLINGTNNNIIGSDPDLAALADNGGFNQTHKPNSRQSSDRHGRNHLPRQRPTRGNTAVQHPLRHRRRRTPRR